eukprot:85747-Rhodomonas_salina.1
MYTAPGSSFRTPNSLSKKRKRREIARNQLPPATLECLVGGAWAFACSMHSVESSESACMHMHAIRDEEGTGTLEFSHGLSYYKSNTSGWHRGEKKEGSVDSSREDVYDFTPSSTPPGPTARQQATSASPDLARYQRIARPQRAGMGIVRCLLPETSRTDKISRWTSKVGSSEWTAGELDQRGEEFCRRNGS